MIYLLLGAGIWFTLRSGFIQFRYIRKFGRSLKNSVTPHPGGLTSFQALCTVPAARLGSGNLAGVALAISAGGPGAVFWMWVTALLGMRPPLRRKFAGATLQRKDKKRAVSRRPSWYMARGLWMRWMGVLFSPFYFVRIRFIFNTVQSNSVAHACAINSSLVRRVYGQRGYSLLSCSPFLLVQGAARLMVVGIPLWPCSGVAASLGRCSTALNRFPSLCPS